MVIFGLMELFFLIGFLLAFFVKEDLKRFEAEKLKSLKDEELKSLK